MLDGAVMWVRPKGRIHAFLGYLAQHSSPKTNISSHLPHAYQASSRLHCCSTDSLAFVPNINIGSASHCTYYHQKH